MKRIAVALLALSLLACASESPSEPATIEAGRWRAWLDSPGGELPFGLELMQSEAGWSAMILNPPERIPVDEVTVDGTQLTLRIPHYDSTIEATLSDDGQLNGRWWKTAALGATSELPFHASFNDERRFISDPDAGERLPIDGRWRVRFNEEDDDAVGIFSSDSDGNVQGTFLTTTGDYRFLTGSVDGNRLRLSVFDGAHAFLFDATLEDETLSGDFWSRDSYHDTWTATRDETMALDDATTQVAWLDGAELGSLSYPDLDGNLRALDDPAFAGNARLVEVFGTWCPNCNDATQYLMELRQRYGDRGLSVLGLAFEMSGSFDRDAEQVRTYIEHHSIDYPILIAGTTDKADASAAFPLIERIKSYPTTIFIDGDGNVKGIWSGFSGPATGVENEKLRGRWESWIEEMLGEG